MFAAFLRNSTQGQELMKEFKGAPALDAGLLAAAQAVEHYEIARYGTLKTLGRGTGAQTGGQVTGTDAFREKRPTKR
jgi:ferritin-like metal-binding protein YciE